jgi:uncharacterized protein YjbJ (UPF0337 family)
MSPNTPVTPIAGGTIESISDRLAREWSRLKHTVLARFNKLTNEDVEAVNGRYDELSSRLNKSYGYDNERIEDEVSRFVSEGGNSAPYTAVADEAMAGDHRGMGAEVGRNDKPLPLVPEQPAHPEAGAHRERH